MRVVHVWDAYTPSLFDQTHAYCLGQPGVRSILLAAHLVENRVPVLPRTYYLDTRHAYDEFAPPLFARAGRRVIREFAELLRRLARRHPDRIPLARAPLVLSRFNRFCLEKVRTFKGELIHAHFGTTGVMILPLIRATRLPSLVTFYGVDGSASVLQPRWKANFREMFQEVRLVLVLCDAVRQRLAEIGCSAEKLRVWNLPAGIEKYPYRSRDTDGDATRFLIAARFVEKKGYPYLLDAFRQTLAAGRDARLTIIGYGPFKPMIEEHIRLRKLQDHVSLIDTELTSDFAGVYRGALDTHDVFVLPSTTGKNGDDEGGPALTMVCAQAAGLPVISTPFPGAERSVIDGRTGVYCRQDDADSLAEKMIWIADHREVWNPIGKAGSDYVRQHFCLEGQMQQLMGMYRQLLEGRNGAV